MVEFVFGLSPPKKGENTGENKHTEEIFVLFLGILGAIVLAIPGSGTLGALFPSILVGGSEMDEREKRGRSNRQRKDGFGVIEMTRGFASPTRLGATTNVLSFRLLLKKAETRISVSSCVFNVVASATVATEFLGSGLETGKERLSIADRSSVSLASYQLSLKRRFEGDFRLSVPIRTLSAA